MKFSFSKHFATQSIAVFSFFTSSHGAYAHITLDEPTALAGRSYKATFKVGHGCEGSPTTAIRVTLPTGLTGAKPMPKAGWVLNVKTSQLAQPYDNHGKQVTEDVAKSRGRRPAKTVGCPRRTMTNSCCVAVCQKTSASRSVTNPLLGGSRCCKPATKAATTGHKCRQAVLTPKA